MELNKYPIVGILKDGTRITDLNNEFFNKYNFLIAMCKSELTKDKVNTEIIIFIDEEKRKVYAESTNGKIYSYIL